MRVSICAAAIFFFLIATGESAEVQPSAELTAIQEAYKAAVGNLVSGSGTGTYEIYAVPPGKGSKLELKVKAKTKVFFDHGKFHIRLDYDKDDFQRLESRIIVYDGTAILVNRMSKYIHPARSEGDIYEAKPHPSVMRLAGFDYDPCELPSEILRADLLSSKFSTNLTITADANMNYTGAYDLTPVVRCSFLASHKDGYHIIAYYESNTNHNNFQHVNRQATWERKNDLWYVKSIDNTWLAVDGSGDRTVFRYTDFEPNAEVSPSLFKFDSLDLAPKARLIDRRQNAEERVLRQSQPSSVDMAKLDTLADAVKALSPSSGLAQLSWFRRHYLLIAGAALCIVGLLLLIWRRRARKGSVAPNP
jgi:hypothetical protein